MVVEGGGGGTLSELYQNSKRLLLKTRDGLERLERLEFSSSTVMDSPELSFAVKKDITQIQSLCVEMDRLWRAVAAKSQRDLWKRKVEQVAEEADSLKESLDKYFLRNQRRTQEAREREELLGRANGESSHVLRIFDEEAQAMQSARNSSRMLEESHATGIAILAQYHAQRDRLKSAQRKALDVLNTLGLSNSVLRLIERRNRVDQWIKYAGMALTIIILIALWRQYCSYRFPQIHHQVSARRKKTRTNMSIEKRSDTVGHAGKIMKRKCKRRTKRPAPKASMALQKLYVSCRDVFKGPGTVPSPNDVQKLCHILDGMMPEDCNNFSLCIFFLPSTAVIPLHNHPEMTVFSKLLVGTMHIKSYDWVDPVNSDESAPHSQLRLARLKANNVFEAPCNTSVLYPTSGGNIHAFTAITPCAVLDVLGPPYSKDDGRGLARTYKETPYHALSNGETEVEQEEGNCYGWLEEIEMPEESEMNWIEYLGPKDYPASSTTSDLETIGRYDFNEQIRSTMIAHPKLDPVFGEPYLKYFRFAPDGRKSLDIEIPLKPQID
ncbi:hypothetical protein F0562_015748 [Nyssa sinensis]|uniref:cysteine dioxygenase n=1 Tax=Nyssa sinensis TaxID=561372 RepID=A0A5J4ZJZ0_9ASTE|nr:hypothetical protein F0562_015748 [Nyssa sinensis]